MECANIVLMNLWEVEVGTNSWEAQLVGGPTEPTQQLPSKIGTNGGPV